MSVFRHAAIVNGFLQVMADAEGESGLKCRHCIYVDRFGIWGENTCSKFCMPVDLDGAACISIITKQNYMFIIFVNRTQCFLLPAIGVVLADGQLFLTITFLYYGISIRLHTYGVS